MSDEIMEPTLKLCWNEHAIRRAAEVLRAAGLQLMAEDVEAQFPKPAIEEPELSFSVINARPSYTDTITTLTKLGDRWVDLDGNDVGAFDTLSDIEVLRIGVGDIERPDVAPEETDDYKLGASDFIFDVLRQLRQLRAEAITSERKNAYDVAISTVEAMQP